MQTSTTMKISLPTKMRNDIKILVRESQSYSTTSGFLQDLISKELLITKEKSKLNDMIQDGLASGVSGQDPLTFFKSLLR